MPATTNNKVLVALSGGVDSSVCVHLLREQGYDVSAVVMEFSPAHKQSVEDAKLVAHNIGVPLHVVQCYDAFQKDVINYFAASYLAGQTPNPCIRCNPTTKFRLLLQTANELDCAHIATGHYAAIERDASGAAFLKKAACRPRDQSYMLYRLGQDVLQRIIFPLNALTKDEVRSIAQKVGIPTANKPDSQEICFIPDNNYPAYITAHFGTSKVGNFIDPNGNICGKNKGILHYTIGQRKGLGISFGEPVFIKHIDPVSGDIFLARKGEELIDTIYLKDCVFAPHIDMHEPLQVGVKVRSMAQEVPATVSLTPIGCCRVVFSQPLRAIAPGQSCVFYKNNLVLGGGGVVATEAGAPAGQ